MFRQVEKGLILVHESAVITYQDVLSALKS